MGSGCSSKVAVIDPSANRRKSTFKEMVQRERTIDKLQSLHKEEVQDFKKRREYFLTLQKHLRQQDEMDYRPQEPSISSGQEESPPTMDVEVPPRKLTGHQQRRSLIDIISPAGTRLQNPLAAPVSPLQSPRSPQRSPQRSPRAPQAPVFLQEKKPTPILGPNLGSRASSFLLFPPSLHDGSEETGAESLGPFEVVPMSTAASTLKLVGRGFEYFTLVVPPHLTYLLTECVPLGRISQWCNVKACDPLYHNKTIIPSSAVHYAFSYPLTGISQEVARMIDYADPFGAFVTIGGFIYVNAKFEVVAVFCLRPVVGQDSLSPRECPRANDKRKSVLKFSAPYRMFENTEEMLMSEDRLARVTLPELRRTGAFFLAWLPPGYATLTHPCPHGAIALFYPDQTLSRYFILLSDQNFLDVGDVESKNLVETEGHVVIQLHYAYNIPISPKEPEKLCTSYVRMWLQEKEERSTHMQVWPLKSGTRDPVWKSARALGPALPNQFLVVELFAGLVGTKCEKVEAISVRSEDLFLNCPTPLYFIKGDEECRMLIQPIAAQPPKTKKIVYFVRHGTSEWNQAQASLANPQSIAKMITKIDHPLAAKGIAEAMALCEKIQKVVENTKKEESPRRVQRSLSKKESAISPTISNENFISTNQIFVSPLTRAVQTALIALQPILISNRCLVVLSPNVREKRNFGGRDSTGESYDRHVEKKILSNLHSALPDRPERVNDILSVVFDSSQVAGCWWCEHRETSLQVRDRIDEMFHQIQYSSESSVIVVGHSHYFREVFRHYVSPSFAEANKNLVNDLRQYVICNCSVVGCEVEFSESRCIVDVKMLFDTKIAGKKETEAVSRSVGTVEEDDVDP